MKYYNNNKQYTVSGVDYFGAIINVNGTSITDCDKMNAVIGMKTSKPTNNFTVFVDGDEVVFKSFEDAYNFATIKQKNTHRI